MKRLILVAILGLAMPVFAAEDSAPTSKAAAASNDTAPAPADAGAAAEASTVGPTRAAAPPLAEPERLERVETRPPLSADAVARATFATAIDQREPVDSITSLESDRDRVYYFSELVGIPGREVTHRWSYQGEVVAEVPIAIGGPRWRAYSIKSLDASQLGEWTVSVVDESGAVLRTDTFVYEETPPVAEATTPAPGTAPDTMPTPEATPTPAAPADREALDEAPASPAPARR